ncbi:MAG: lysozyme inhibitor LprI family protein [Undibacterium umbellatum]|uniref:lysozyme inhibitor LprI family protein n=1 Tax=Undibacterium umbellatum TaxID=2762300 RepID=UPI003BB6346A
MRVLKYLLFLPPLMLSAGTQAQRAASGEDCFSLGGQADARECLGKRVTQSDFTLRQVEADTLASVSEWDDTAANRTRVKSKLLSSGRQYLLYRTEQCELQANLAAGGTGTSHRRYLCILEMNEQRIAHLQSVKEVTNR